MVKDRKLQLGVSNLTSRSNHLPDVDIKDNSDIKKPQPTKFYRSPSHKLISPDIYQTIADPTFVRAIANIATWKRAEVLKRDFTTTHKISFQNPSSIPKKNHDIFSTSFSQNDLQIEKRQRQEVSLRKFCATTKTTYGTIGEMLKLVCLILNKCNMLLFNQFKKKQGDDISLYEVNQYLRRQKVNFDEVSEDDVKQIFDSIDSRHKGSVPVESFLKKTEEEEYNLNYQKKDLQKLKDFLSIGVSKSMSDLQDSSSSEIDKIKKMKSIENEAELFRIALGSRPLGDLHHELFDASIEEVLDGHHLHPMVSEQNQFARMLNHGNVRLDAIPFYQMRSEELAASKHKAAVMHHQVTSPDLQGRLRELSEVRWRGSLSSINSLDDDLQKTYLSMPTSPNNKDYNNNNNYNNNTTSITTSTSTSTSFPAKQQLPPPPHLSDQSKSITGGQGGHYHVDTEDRRFLSTNQLMFPPIDYSAGGGSGKRNIASEAEEQFRRRELVRQQRYNRSKANQDVTRIRLEHDQLNKEVRDLNTLSRKMDDRIRYQTKILLEDLKNYKQVTFARAAKKPNIALADKMFGGQLDRMTAGVVPENRDFLTTYNSSFPLASSP